MALVDELAFKASAGTGGDGVVRWLNLKGKEFSGPAGGNGGNGGDVYIHAVRDVNLLSKYRGEKKFAAKSGDAGQGRNKHGKAGADLTINLPVGSIVTNTSSGEIFELHEEGETKLILKGGRGGAGNAVFKSSVNQSPMESTPGGRGEEGLMQVELRLIADAGFIGLPNAGKSSLLNSLTHADAKVGAYAFTTLDPNLGALYEFVLADIPGLIEGASGGKGLGFKFLRHIARTRLLVHCVSLEAPDPKRDYQNVRTEIEAFEGGILTNKKELIVLTKSDTTDADTTAQAVKYFAGKCKKEVQVVSILDEASLKDLRDSLIALLRNLDSK